MSLQNPSPLSNPSPQMPPSHQLCQEHLAEVTSFGDRLSTVATQPKSLGPMPPAPSWTTLPNESSDEEDPLQPDTQSTTPEPEGKTSAQSKIPTLVKPGPGPWTHPIQPLFYALSVDTWETSSHLKPDHGQGSTKRLIPRDQEAAIAPQRKKQRYSGFGRSSNVTNILDSVRPTGSELWRAPNPGPNTPTMLGSHAQLAPNGPHSMPHLHLRRRDEAPPASSTSAVALRRALSPTAGAPARPQRTRRPYPPIAEDSDVGDWERVDKMLGTHVAPAVVLPAYAPLRRVQGGDQGPLHVPLQRDDFWRGSKGKGRAQRGWTETRWSNVGEFKERLDTMFGPGDIIRGHSRAPKNAKKFDAHKGSSMTEVDVATLNEGDLRPDADNSAITDEDGETGITTPACGRGRLEKVDPRK
ncbi:hypothetical protein BD413DRAFT_546342 [Trametes elegans]|nr:hypothetical protein BD413DRAFT_546342 [Trametes elegans]